MSYRDLRNFTEMMHELGYPRLISMENFRTPNFQLVAEILTWLVKRFDLDLEIPLGIDNEDERIALIRSIAQLLVIKVNLKLNMKKLYQADGYAVKEMLKVTTLLHESLKTANVENKEVDELPEISPVATAMKVQELKLATHLIGEIISTGASLFELLGKEGELREFRNNRAYRHMEMPQVEQAVKDCIGIVSKEINNTEQLIGTALSNERTLEATISKKKSDLDRHNKRLETLKKIRPAFMEEFEKLEEELKGHYKDYVIKCRNLAFLENILEQTEQAEQKRIDLKQVMTRKLIEYLEQEEASIRSDVCSEGLDDISKTYQRPLDSLSRRNAGVKDVHERQQRQRKVFGAMTGGVNDSESLGDSDSDLLLDGDITEDDELEVENQPVHDDDF